MMTLVKKFLCFVVLLGLLPFAGHADHPSETLVIFGGSGDLAKKKLLPALAQLEEQGKLPKDFLCIALGRTATSDMQPPEILTGKVEYMQINYDALSKKLAGKHPLFYLATPPSAFSPIVKDLHEHQLLHDAKVVVEKPFGTDLASAQVLQQELLHYLEESQIYRMDHYLGKEAVRNLLQFRLTHPSIEKRWNRAHIESISVTLSEKIGVGSRGAFWEETGLLRDVVQNHIMQIISLIGMELPVDLSFNEIRKEKIRLIQATQLAELLRGQYGPGIVDGKKVPGYREEQEVAANSKIETYIAAKLLIDNERWQGVPFFIKAGKRLPENLVEIKVVFSSKEQLIIRIQPNPVITMGHQVLLQMPQTDAYANLIQDALSGNPSHFVSYEESLASWKLFAQELKGAGVEPVEYPAGSEGPALEWVYCNPQ